MNRILSAQNVADLVRRKREIEVTLKESILTPAALNLLQSEQKETAQRKNPSSKPENPSVPDHEHRWIRESDPQTKEEIESFFRSQAIEALKERMVDIGRRLWERNYVDGNGGNITIRVGDNLVLSTPTLISKGFMTTEDLCLVDFEGNQLAGISSHPISSKSSFIKPLTPHVPWR